SSLSSGATLIPYGEEYIYPVNNNTNILIYQDKDNYEVAQIDNIDENNNIITVNPIVRNYDRYRVVPLYDGYINNGISINNNRKYSEFNVEIITNDIPSNQGEILFSQYLNYYVNDLLHVEQQSRNVNQDITMIDSNTGYFDLIEQRLYNNDLL